MFDVTYTTTTDREKHIKFVSPQAAKKWIDSKTENSGIKVESVVDDYGNVVSINPYADDSWCGILYKKEES